MTRTPRRREEPETPRDEESVSLALAQMARRRRMSRNVSPRVTEDGSPYKLDKDAKNICRALMIQGETIFDELGWTQNMREDFKSRKAVKTELERLKYLWDERNAIQDRAAFYAFAELQRMIPSALGILTLRLRGEIDPKTKKPYADQMPMPDDTQYAAALEVLDRTGIRKTKFDPTYSAPKIETNIIVGADDTASLDSTVARDRVRSVIGAIAHNANAAVRLKGKKRAAALVVTETEEGG